MKIPQILEQARTGNLECCKNCPWSPKYVKRAGFGVSCTEHGINWEIEGKANSMLIAQDPGDTTPHQTGRLCIVHNAENPTDTTAQHALRLWNATVSLNHNNPAAGGYLKKHYWVNSIMHGVSKKEEKLRKKIQGARKCCRNVLDLQIAALKPNVIIAYGAEAANSLYEIGILKKGWSSIRKHFNNGAYSEDINSWRGIKIKALCTYHTSKRAIDTISVYYDSQTTEKSIEEKTKKIGYPNSIIQFLSIYAKADISKEHRGMRYLLNHWLDIGEAIRTGSN